MAFWRPGLSFPGKASRRSGHFQEEDGAGPTQAFESLPGRGAEASPNGGLLAAPRPPAPQLPTEPPTHPLFLVILPLVPGVTAWGILGSPRQGPRSPQLRGCGVDSRPSPASRFWGPRPLPPFWMHLMTRKKSM